MNNWHWADRQIQARVAFRGLNFWDEKRSSLNYVTSNWVQNTFDFGGESPSAHPTTDARDRHFNISSGVQISPPLNEFGGVIVLQRGGKRPTTPRRILTLGHHPLCHRMSEWLFYWLSLCVRTACCTWNEMYSRREAEDAAPSDYHPQRVGGVVNGKVVHLGERSY